MKILHLTGLFLTLWYWGIPLTAIAAPLPEDSAKAVILAYYKIGENLYPDSSLRRDQFIEHINEIIQRDYTVLPVTEILKSLKQGEELPPRTIGITFQGGFRSAQQNAFPLLDKHNLPYTVFFTAETTTSQSSQYLNWADLQELKKNKNITLGLMPERYIKPSAQTNAENKRLLNRARITFRKQFKQEPTLFAYPFGEFNQNYYNFIQTQQFLGAFGLQSGPVFEGSDFTALPRFVMTEHYGDLERLQNITNALPLPATDIEPKVSLLDKKIANLGFTIPPQHQNLAEKINCYASGQGKIKTEILGTQRIEIRPQLNTGERLRINCTSPVLIQKNPDTFAYRWLGFLLSTEQEQSETTILSEPEEKENPL